MNTGNSITFLTIFYDCIYIFLVFFPKIFLRWSFETGIKYDRLRREIILSATVVCIYHISCILRDIKSCMFKYTNETASLATVRLIPIALQKYCLMAYLYFCVENFLFIVLNFILISYSFIFVTHIGAGTRWLNCRFWDDC